MARLKQLARGDSEQDRSEKVVFNFQELERHGIELKADATPEQVRAALIRLLALLARQD